MTDDQDRQLQEQQLHDELFRCILLTEEDKTFWSENASSLPQVVLDNVLRIVQEKNKTVDEYVAAALAEDKDHRYLAELKAKIQQIKKKVFELEEGEKKEDLEKMLEEQLKDV